jgi:ABC-type dipeptide/oligopeptide/nickel transport system permease component
MRRRWLVLGILNNLPLLIAGLLLLAFLVFTGIRVGPNFLIRRLAGLVFVVFGVSFVTFLLVLIGAGPNGELAVIGQCTTHCTPAILRNLENFYGLRDPWYIQYVHYLNRLAHFDLGFSFTNREIRVWDILQSGVPISLSIQIEAISLNLLIGIPLGVITALRAGTRFDTSFNGAALLFYAMPAYLLIVIYRIFTLFLALNHLPHLPISGWDGPFSLTAIAPVLTLTALGTAFFVRLTRTSMLEVLGQDYIRTARAKGLRERTVVFRHGLRNAMIPLITALGPILAFAFSGAFFTETLFNIPGIGYASVTSVLSKDTPIIQGTVLLAALAVTVMNLITDVVYGLLDPRIKVA